VNPEQELADVYAPFTQKNRDLEPTTREIRYVDAISEGLRQSLERHKELVFLGQDIAEYGGVFKISEGFLEQFGPLRIRNTPLCESAIVGITLGLSIAGMKSVMEMQFADFVTCGFNQIVNNLAKSYYRWAQNADVVIRMPTGAGVNAGPFHSQSNEAWFFHTPGLKIVYPSTPAAAKGLLCAAIEDPNPYLFFEHKYLYRSLKGPVVEDYHTMEIGKAQVALKGSRLTIVTYGMGVHWALEASKTVDGLEIIDLCTLMPWDKETVSASVKKTNKSLVFHEDCITGGIGAEIAAWIGAHCFEDLDAPVLRVGSLDTPVPFSNALEQIFLPQQRLLEQLDYLLKY
jgi:2-oxoisovalerate dehydrogenase E1 component